MLHNVPLKAFTLQKGVEVTLWQCFCNGKMYPCFEVCLIGAEMKISQLLKFLVWLMLCSRSYHPHHRMRLTQMERWGAGRRDRGPVSWTCSARGAAAPEEEEDPRHPGGLSGRVAADRGARGCRSTGRSEAMVQDEAAKQGNTVKSDRVNGWIKRSSCTNVCLSYGSCDAQGRNHEILSRSILMSV